MRKPVYKKIYKRGYPKAVKKNSSRAVTGAVLIVSVGMLQVREVFLYDAPLDAMLIACGLGGDLNGIGAIRLIGSPLLA